MTSTAAGERRSSSPPPSTLLAPGFRFHPTDEELVSYYLKRKVSGRPLRVDPISEVDLYKCEPWDLPAQSRIRSRDMEWYFFSPLDRKYANRSRTNRATAQGYWKTTGKDRPVRHGGRTVGMKKTLVFHVGRAPRGQRSNWVMHEYRLEGEDLPSSSIPQDSFVVCRIFQKSGPGPQNGAQYGAPFVEEEWEEDREGEGNVVAQIGNDDAFTEAAGNQDYFLPTEILENDEKGNQQDNTADLALESLEHNNIVNSMEPSTFLEGFIDQNLVNEADGYITVPDEYNEVPSNVGDDSQGLPLQSNGGSPGPSDAYLELNDLINIENGSRLCNEEHTDDVFHKGMARDQVDPLANGGSTVTEMNADEFFDILNEHVEPPEPFQNSSTLKDGMSLQANDVLNPQPDEYPLSRSSNGNLVYYEMPCQEVPLKEEYFAQANDYLVCMDDSSGIDMDELMAFFDATDDKLHSEPSNYIQNDGGLDSYTFKHHKRDEQFEDQGLDSPKVYPQATHVGNEVASSSSSLAAKDTISTEKADVPCEDDTQRGQDKMNLTKRLVSMLGSISSPPALAAEFPAKSAKASAQSSASPIGGSIHVTAGMIHIRNLTLPGDGDHWSGQKNGSLEFLFSYGMSGSGIVGKSIGFEPKTNMHGGAPSVVLRGWFYVIFISALFLAATYRIGVSICSR